MTYFGVFVPLKKCWELKGDQEDTLKMQDTDKGWEPRKLSGVQRICFARSLVSYEMSKQSVSGFAS